MSWRDRILQLDRRWIFALVALCILVPLLHPFGLKATETTPMVQSMVDKIDSLGPDDCILMSMDFDPGSKPELEPMAKVILRHAMEREVPIVCMTLWPTGADLASTIIADVADEYGAERNQDYAFLGFMVGAQAVIAQMSVDIYNTFPTDYWKTPTSELPILQGRKTLKDFDYVICIAAGDPGVDTWVIYGEGIRTIGGGCTAVSVSHYLAYYQSKQINGLMGGLKGASEYEVALRKEYRSMRDKDAPGTQKMEAQSVVHFLIIILIIICNIFFFLDLRQQRRGG
jgi:hypothetical protein